ncbi:hypothetical protein ABID22_002993 [Pontibacter aydingkolensis]|uniref:DUF4249 domain-containing protein n=1 Tax=Pontibacter aydingkolensis TaxID=1911536 RepID=A0ABS7CUL3_9BACT|nr:DUF4249 domain-containing protein [Pontibacter aydingkolensis]MBW7467495.1 DUF4249 domain-containing protein [Pontibacter aydingkolensis]
MKTYRIIPFIILIAITLLTACEKDADNVKPFKVDSKLVVHAFISPQDTVLKVHLQKSQPALGRRLSEEQLQVPNANVTISDGSSAVTLTYDPDHNAYFSKLREWAIVAGKTYTLKVTAPGGYAATASCSVPEATGIAITDVSTSTTTETDYYGGEMKRYKVAYKWTDAPGVNNYYRTLAAKVFWHKNYYGDRQRVAEPAHLDRGKPGLYKDDKAQGGVLTSDDFYYYQGAQSPDIEKQYQLHLLLVVSDKNYYLYQDAQYKQSQSNGNPFAEPVVMYSNIEGGLGVFAGYNQVEALIDME